MFKKLTLGLLSVALLSTGFWSCKTTEANYRAAYERAMAGRDSALALENTIYGHERQRIDTRKIRVGQDTIEVMRQLVKITPDGGGIRENLRQYCVVVGRFKQRFNALQMQERITAEGDVPGAFVVETAEPFYYVVSRSFSTLQEAAAMVADYRRKPPLPMKSPLPFILQATAK